MKIGDRVHFTGSHPNQVNWGSCDDPTGLLFTNHIYAVSDVEVHSWHTKLSFKGIEGKFNSVCFEKIEN